VRAFLFVSLVSFFSYPLLAQDSGRQEIDIQALADELLGYPDQDLNYEDLYENLLQLLSNPVNINTAKQEELRSLLVLSEYQIQQLISYRNEQGALLEVYELQAIPGFDQQTIHRLLPFITIQDQRSGLNKALINRILHNDNNYLVSRYERLIESKNGFKQTGEKQFLGDRGKYYTRLRSSIPNDFSVGFTLEQDAGEPFRWSSSYKQYGIDFASAHIQLQNKGRLKNLILGDYQVQAGQGLVLGGAFGMGKGGETITTTRRINLLSMPYTSVLENGYLRGVTATYQVLPQVSVTSFLSRIARDANANTDSLGEGTVSSLLSSGLHRNEQELLDRKQLQETTIGSIINYQVKALEVGAVYKHTLYDKDVSSQPNIYNQFAFRGNKNGNASIYGSYSLLNFHFFGELAQTVGEGRGVVAGTLGSLTPALDIAMIYRNYQRNFHSFYSNAFAESTQAQNERGIYWGAKYRFNKQYELSGYMDMFEFPWLRFQRYRPTVGYETLLRFHYQPSRSVAAFIQVRQEVKERNLPGDDPSYLIGVGIKRNLTLQTNYSAGRMLHLKTRLQMSDYTLNNVTTTGFALVQDVTADLGKIRLTGRYALFDSEDFTNRQYVAEKDMWLAYSFPAYQDRGARKYIMIQYDVNKRYTCWLRYAHTRIANAGSTGSNLDETEGTDRNEIKFQVRIKI
jgi:hypothetical protein